MRQKKILLFIVFLFTAVSGFCQEDYKLLQLKIAPLNIIDPLTGVVQIGIQKRFTEKIALAIDYGIRFNKLSVYSYNSERHEVRYSKTKIELKIYRKTSSKIHAPYFSIQGFFFPEHYRKENDFIFHDNKSFRYVFSNVRRNAIITSFIIGKEIIRRRWIFDKYIGAGLRVINIKHHTSGEVETEWFQPKGFHIESIDLREGNYFRPHIVAGFKLGYILK